MKIQIFNQELKNITNNVESSVEHILNNVEPGVVLEGIQYDLDLVLKFKIEGREEYQVVTTDREIFGLKELYTIRPFFDAEGYMITDDVLDNKEESFEKVAESLDKELPTECIESQFAAEDLVEKLNEFKAPDESLVEVLYKHKDGFLVLQYYRGGVGLVHELQLVDKQEGMDNEFDMEQIDFEVNPSTEEIIDVDVTTVPSNEKEEEEIVEYPSCGFTKCTSCE